jgi:hypothetical protein
MENQQVYSPPTTGYLELVISKFDTQETAGAGFTAVSLKEAWG